ncbi:bifunctional DNA primase/polymerase [Amycolatopsis cynarae]|uniref:Bifunctional DNA primase/polymerase n=1 Tax=Amycolatopsis cynarae TaxID=2995223 RepID=A0ABY7B3S3_9PSEU|nr:bifunctional DNA primase/polymerase [Amycolatopsis sp. HUAS 11-8]WAL66084.1 bifunctional DNA primase/polymerase [Amycolatopsis sp. HUAS 11-8]
MLDTDWSDSWRSAFRIELRAEAIGLAWHGWPVLPGTFPEMEPDAESWSGPVPVHEDWADRLGAHPNEVAEWWTGRPYSLLVATGKVVDAIEVGVELGKRAARLLRATGHPAPIVATPDGRWLFLTAAADGLPEQLAVSGEVRWHGEGSWVPLPPTPYQHGVVHWRVKPEVCGWRLPEATAVHSVLAQALDQAEASTQLVAAAPVAA